MTETITHIDNFDIINGILDFSEPNTFYFVQVLKWRKENPDMKTNVRVINNYYIYSNKDLVNLKPKITADCELHNARAYINLNRLNLVKIALYTQKIIIEYIIAEQYENVKNAYSVACGNHHSEHENENDDEDTEDVGGYTSEKVKKWVIDIDTKDEHVKAEILAHVAELHKEFKREPPYRVIAEIPTKNGVHVISNPFNLKKFKDTYKDVDVHKNSPTLLYYSFSIEI